MCPERSTAREIGASFSRDRCVRGGYAPECLTPASPHVRQQNPLHHGTGAALAGPLVDALTALANGLNLRAKLVYAGGVCGQWLMDHNSDRSIWFHLVSKGRGWVHSPAWAAPLEVADGDLMPFLPHTAKHFLSYSPAPSSERHGRHAPHPLRRCRTGDSFLAQILREDFNATGDAGDAKLNLDNTGDRP